jgi:hypothetical protein
LLIVALAAVASSGRGLVSVWVLASAITAAGAMPGHRMATGGSVVTPVTPTTDYSGSFRLAGVGTFLRTLAASVAQAGGS